MRLTNRSEQAQTDYAYLLNKYIRAQLIGIKFTQAHASQLALKSSVLDTALLYTSAYNLAPPRRTGRWAISGL